MVLRKERRVLPPVPPRPIRRWFVLGIEELEYDKSQEMRRASARFERYKFVTESVVMARSPVLRRGFSLDVFRDHEIGAVAILTCKEQVTAVWRGGQRTVPAYGQPVDPRDHAFHSRGGVQKVESIRVHGGIAFGRRNIVEA